MPKCLLDIRIFHLDCSPAEQINLVDLETQLPVQHLEPGKETLGIPHCAQDTWNQNAGELSQALTAVVGLVHQFAKALFDEPPDLPWQSGRQPRLQMHQRFKRSTATDAVILAKGCCDPIRVIGEEV